MMIYCLDLLLFLFGVCCSMSSSNCCFLTWIQVSQEAGQVVLYSHLLKNFPQFILIHTVKGIDIVSKTEIYVSLKVSCFFDDPADVGNFISSSSAFSKSSLNIWKFMVHMYCWSLAWRILSVTLLSIWDECNCVVVWAFAGIVFLWDWNEYWTFPVLRSLMSFPNLLAYWVKHFNSIIF